MEDRLLFDGRFFFDYDECGRFRRRFRLRNAAGYRVHKQPEVAENCALHIHLTGALAFGPIEAERNLTDSRIHHAELQQHFNDADETFFLNESLAIGGEHAIEKGACDRPGRRS